MGHPDGMEADCGMTIDARYDEIADFYASATDDIDSDPVAQALLDLLGDVAGLRVLDLACGHGRITRELRRRGAHVVGADISTKLLDKAQALEQSHPLGIMYLHADARAPAAFGDESFDAVACNYGLSDIDRLDAVLATVGRVLEPDGIFVFSILHPCFPGAGPDAPSAWPPGGGYYQEGWWLADNTGFRGKVGSNFRMLSTYLNALVDHRLAIDWVAEPPPSSQWAERKPSPEPVPFALVVRCRHAQPG